MELCFKYPLLRYVMCVYIYMCVCVCLSVCVHTCIAYPYKEGVVKMHWCHSAPLLYTACLDGVVRLWDARNASTVHSWEGHTNHLLDMDITRCIETVFTIFLCSTDRVVHRDNSTIITACEDGTARIFSHQF